MNGNDENMLFWSQFKFWITFQLHFLEWFFFFSYFIHNLGKEIEIKIKKNKIIVSTLFYIIISLELFISEKQQFYCISMEVLYQKNGK